MINHNTIERVLNAASIEEIVSGYTLLRKSGSKFVGKCPFHDDTHATNFYVTPALGICKCFACGEGGNVISFLRKKEGYTFPEAVKTLAKRYNIDVEEREDSPDEIKENLKREAMFNINELVSAFFQEQGINSQKAKEYTGSRWDPAICKLMSVGYAPDSWDTLYNWAREKRIDIDLMIEMGLLQVTGKGNIIDSFRDRITMPIFSRSGRIEGFTARFIGEGEVPKYINSKDSEIYAKSKSLFGLGQAYRHAVKEGQIYIVEGASDVMRMIQIKAYNTVAPLGTSLTEPQLKVIFKITSKIIFLPDADKPGITAVMKHGRTALKMGFTVTVREIPSAEGINKNDPDSYLCNSEMLRKLPETDFIIWYAEKSLYANIPISEAQVIVSEICEMLIQIDDQTAIGMYIEKLSSIPGGGKISLWKKALETARDKQNGIKKDDGKIDTYDLEKYGFWEENGSYWSTGKEGDIRQWSNFTMQPMFHILDAVNPKRLYKICNYAGHEQIVEMKQEELISLAKFKLKVEGLGNFIWETSESHLVRLKKYLYEKTETAVEITQLGWQKKGCYYAWGNGVFDDRFYQTDDYGIVRLDGENVYIPSNSKIYAAEKNLFQFEKKFVHLNYNHISLNDYSLKLIDVFGDNAKISLCFLVATLFRDIVTNYTKSFPILNLFGPKGAGKSEMGHSLMSFFIIKNTPPNLSNATIPALADAVAQCSNAIVHLDEFKNNMDLEKREFLKGLWDGTGRSRMNMERDKKREITSVDTGVIVSGQEMATADIALFSRFVFLCFNQTEYSQLEKQRFDELKRIEGNGLTHLTIEILSHRQRFETGFVSAYKDVADKLATRLRNEGIEDRIYRNWLILLASFKCIERYIVVPFKYDEMFDLIVEGIVKQNSECKSNNELSNFWNVFNYLSTSGEIFMDSDYRIVSVDKLLTNRVNWEGNEYRKFLCVSKSRIFMLYKKYARQTGENILPESALKHYLEISNLYMGEKVYKFRSIINGIEVRRDNRAVSKSERAMVFDYVKLKEMYGIDLEVYSETDD